MANNSRQLTLGNFFAPKETKENESDKPKASKREADRLYDTEKRKRTFQSSWQQGRQWLVFEKGAMFCQICRTNKFGFADSSTAMATGSTCFQLTVVTKHEKSEKHTREQAACEAAEKPVEESQAFSMLKKMNQTKINQLCIKFRNVHALLKQKRPFSDFEWMNELDQLKGLDVGHEYGSDKSAATFAYHIAQVIGEK